jgi:hypothetical protein
VLILKNHLSKPKGNLEENIKKLTWSGLGLKRKRKSKKVVSKQTWESEVYFDREIMEKIKATLDIFLKRGIQTCRK